MLDGRGGFTESWRRRAPSRPSRCVPPPPSWKRPHGRSCPLRPHRRTVSPLPMPGCRPPRADQFDQQPGRIGLEIATCVSMRPCVSARERGLSLRGLHSRSPVPPLHDLVELRVRRPGLRTRIRTPEPLGEATSALQILPILVTKVSASSTMTIRRRFEKKGSVRSSSRTSASDATSPRTG